jgi:hypothetical protein
VAIDASSDPFEPRAITPSKGEPSSHQHLSFEPSVAEPSIVEPFELFDLMKNSCVLSANSAAYFQHLSYASVIIFRAIEPSRSELRAYDMGTVGQPSYQHSSLPIQSKNSCVLSANSAAYFQKNQVIAQRLIIAIEPSRLELRFNRHQASSHPRNSSFIL